MQYEGQYLKTLAHTLADQSFALTRTFDALGNPLSEAHSGNAELNQNYSYDGANRLATFSRGATRPGLVKDQNWALDSLGNWKQTGSDFGSGIRNESRHHNALNQTLQRSGDLYAGPDATTWNPSYDQAGFINSDGHRTFSWDGSGLLKSVSQPSILVTGTPNALPSGNWTFSYDTKRRRVTDGNIWYIYDGWRVVEERNLTDFSLQKTFIYASYIDEVISMEARYEPAPGTPVNGYGFPEGTDAQISDGFYHAPPSKTNTLLKRYYYHTNAIYSVMALSNNQGELTETYTYDPYGCVSIATSKGPDNLFFSIDDTVALQSTLGNPYTFTGQRLDASGLMYYKNRYYHTELGRFASRDPIGYKNGDFNLFMLARGIPNTVIDSLGLRDHRPIYGLSALACNKKACGPDITGALEELKGEVQKYYNTKSALGRFKLCYGWWGNMAWDIYDLHHCQVFDENCPKSKLCHCTVTMYGVCVRDHEANYFLWGVLSQLCDVPLFRAQKDVTKWKGLAYQSYPSPATLWAVSKGYGQGGITPPTLYTSCDICKTQWTRRLKWKWGWSGDPI